MTKRSLKTYRWLLLLIISFAGMYSCEKNDTEPINSPSPTDTVHAEYGVNISYYQELE